MLEPLFAIVCQDVPNSKSIRMEKLADHLAHMEKIMDRVAVASPLRDEEENFVGALLVVKVKSKAEAEHLLKSDPYFKAGVWRSYDIHMFGPAAGEWVGGASW